MTVPNWKIERYLLGELPEGEMATLKALENESDIFRFQLEQLKINNEELLANFPMPQMPQTADMPHNAPWRLVAALLLCTTVLVAVFSTQNTEETTRVKGFKTDLEIWRKTEDSAEKLSNNSKVAAGDLLQIRYSAEEKCYGVLLSMDGSGILTIHLAGGNGKAALLEGGKIISLEKAYELDNAPKFETFYLITNNEEFMLAPIAEVLLQGKLPNKLQVAQITLKK